MRQLLLDISAENPQTFDTFVTGQNLELLQRLRDVSSERAQNTLSDRFIYVWANARRQVTSVARGRQCPLKACA